ncbi:MAG: DUF4157 domain-containing protein [Reyranella sp.]|uniref:eCIS core domain-containing protein n=1 Tax=Reyranella sp. TaxID=1929291 RepID=UPI003D134C11
MQTHAVKNTGPTEAARKRPDAGRPARPIAHDGFLPDASLSEIPILPDGRDGAPSALHRHAAGIGPSSVPANVREELRRPGRSLPAGLRGEMEQRLGCDFSDVRLHTDAEAGKSAEAVAAEAYTVGRHIVFAAGRFDPGSLSGRRLLTHELVHAASLPRGSGLPAGELRISAPSEMVERHAVAVAGGALAPPAMTTVTSPALYRAPAPVVDLAGVSVNHSRVTVPPPAKHGLKATIDPSNATGVTLAVIAGSAAIAAGTTINSATGAITIDAKQSGGSADVEATQTDTGLSATAGGFNFTAVPGNINATTASAPGNAGFYGGEFVHTFDPPAGGAATELELAHVNEKFKGASGTLLTISGKLGTLKITVNDPASATAGWDLDDTGAMAGPDHVTWDHGADARPFVKNASNPAPADTLPQELTVTQNMRTLEFPTMKYGATVASPTHRRAIEERTGKLKAVTSANVPGINVEVEEDYAGPTIFRNATATPDTIPATPPGGTATTSTITVDAEGAPPTTTTFEVNLPDLGCKVDAAGVLTPGATAGTVMVRAGDGTNFDETKVTITAAPTPTPPGTP